MSRNLKPAKDKNPKENAQSRLAGQGGLFYKLRYVGIAMDKLQACAMAFEKLLNWEYYIILGRKGKTVEIRLNFDKWDFHHLLGLGKLKDLHIANQNRTKVFEDIISGRITYKTVAQSGFFPLIANRLGPLTCIEQLLDDNRIIFRYNSKQNKFSLIEADFLLSTYSNDNEVYIFIAENKEQKFFCRSFFPKEKSDYTLGQARYAMLYKEKRNKKSFETIIQCNKLMNR